MIGATAEEVQEKVAGNGSEARKMSQTEYEIKALNTVQISMRINSYVLLFGVPALITCIILGTLAANWMFMRPRVEAAVNVAAPNVRAEITTPAPNVTVNPSALTVENKITTPAPNVTVTPSAAEPPRVTISIPEGKKGEVQVVEKIVEKTRDVPVPVYIETSDKAAVTLNDIYASAERYANACCAKAGKDPKAETTRWLDAWQGRVKERGDEQVLANEVLIEKRAGFNVESAKVEQVLEVCRLILRYRDARLAVPSAFKEFLTADNLVKFKQFLDRGSQ